MPYFAGFYILRLVNRHRHGAELDADGNGTSSDEHDHTHKITEWNVESTNGHFHMIKWKIPQDHPERTIFPVT